MADAKPADGGWLRLTRSIHAWCGVFLALFVAVIALTGAASAFRAQLLAPTVPGSTAPPAPTASFGPALKAFQAREPTPVALVLFNINGAGLHTVFLKDGRSVFLDATGRTVAARPGMNWDAFVHQLHASLLLGPRGHAAVGVIGLLATGMGLSGVVVWLAGRPRLPAWPKSLRRADLLAVHRDWSGALSLLILIEVATGAALIYDAALRQALHVPAPAIPTVTVADAPPDLAAMVEGVRRRFPGARIEQIVAPGEPRRPFEIGLLQPGDAGSATAYVGPDGTVAAIVQDRTPPLRTRVMNAFGAVHYGSAFGPLAKPFLVLSGLGLGLTSLAGAWSFLLRPRRRS